MTTAPIYQVITQSFRTQIEKHRDHNDRPGAKRLREAVWDMADKLADFGYNRDQFIADCGAVQPKPQHYSPRQSFDELMREAATGGRP